MVYSVENILFVRSSFPLCHDQNVTNLLGLNNGNGMDWYIISPDDSNSSKFRCLYIMLLS